MNIQDYLNTSVLRQLLYCIRQKTNIYMNIYIYIYINGDQIYEQTCTLWMEWRWAGQNRTCIDFQEKYFSMNGYVSCVTGCFIQRERGRSYQGQTRRHHTEDTDTLTRMGIGNTKQDGLSLLRMLDIFKHQEWNIRIFILEWTRHGIMHSLSVWAEWLKRKYIVGSMDTHCEGLLTANV